VGHVLQHHVDLAVTTHGGADPSWPSDWAEVLPKVSDKFSSQSCPCHININYTLALRSFLTFYTLTFA